VARSERFAGLGVDVERADPLTAAVAARVCTPRERERLAGLPPPPGSDWTKLVFSAKESVYKCYYPLARTPLGGLKPDDYAIARTDPMYPIFGPGYLASAIRFARRVGRSPRVFFAGDYLVGPGLEAALTSGLRAAAEVARAGSLAAARRA